MDELELLKKDWNKDSEEFKSYSEDEIFKMIKKNSVSVSKSLLMIGVLEIIFWFLFYYLDTGKDESFFSLKLILRSFLFLSFLGILLFSFYKINNEMNSKKLMKQILNLRKSIFIYVGLMFLSIFIFGVIDFEKDSEGALNAYVKGYNEGSTNKTSIMKASDLEIELGYLMYGLTFLFGIVILYFVYKNIYGSLLEKLKSNYKELSKLEESNT